MMMAVRSPRALSLTPTVKPRYRTKRARGERLRVEQEKARADLVRWEFRTLDVPASHSDVSVSLNEVDWTVTTKITPDFGPYRKAVFSFLIYFPRSYPSSPPHVRCLTPIWHPNVDVLTLKVSLTMAGGGCGFLHTAIAELLSILWYPETGAAPLNLEAHAHLSQGCGAFEGVVREVLRGGFFYQYHFPRLIGDGFLPSRFWAYSRQQRDAIITLQFIWHTDCRAAKDACVSFLGLLPSELLHSIYDHIVA